MQLRYEQIHGMHVRTADGQTVGRVTDLVAEGKNGELCVTAMVIGPVGAARRIGRTRSPLFQFVSVKRIPWRYVAKIDDEIHLRADSTEIERLVDQAREGDAA